MFGAVTIQIGSSGSLIVTELILIFPEVEPVEVYDYGIGAFGENGIVCDPIGGRVVHLEVRMWLGPTHFGEDLAEGDHLLGGDKEGR